MIQNSKYTDFQQINWWIRPVNLPNIEINNIGRFWSHRLTNLDHDDKNVLKQQEVYVAFSQERGVTISISIFAENH